MLKKVGLLIAWGWLFLVMVSHLAMLYPEAAGFILKTPALRPYRSMACAHHEFRWCANAPPYAELGHR